LSGGGVGLSQHAQFVFGGEGSALGVGDHLRVRSWRGGRFGREDIPLLVILIPILALLSNYDQENCLIHVGTEGNLYSVNSRLIGARVEARLYLDHVEVWYGQKKVEDLPRLRGRSKHRVDYRHIVEWLIRKPGAFENYRYPEDLFPTSRFRMAYDALRETTPSRSSKAYLKILKLAAEAGEVQVDEALRELLEGKAEAVIPVESIREVLAKLDTIAPVTMVEVAPVDLAGFDPLCTEMGVRS
jgi:hypothetical protein